MLFNYFIRNLLSADNTKKKHYNSDDKKYVNEITDSVSGDYSE